MMNETLRNEKDIREYLLGRVSDETLLAEFEELLFLDEEFCALAEIVEDALINDFVFERLSKDDSADFAATLVNNTERREKTSLTRAITEKAAAKGAAEFQAKPSFFESLAAFFKQPLNAGAFAVVLIGIAALSFFLLTRERATELAELKTIYQKERPTQTRISGFNYAPLAVTRGEAEEREKNKLRRIENNLLEAVENDPTAANHYALGVFLLTQRKYGAAIAEFESASKLDVGNPKFRSDLGSAYFEFAVNGPKEQRLENLARANEAFTKALELDGNLLEALFNKALVLQEMDLPRQAKESWNKYLEKDPNSQWAEEARKNLEKVSQMENVFRSKEQILQDFLAAYRVGNSQLALQIHNETKGYLKDISLPLQLTRRLLEARENRDGPEANESLSALIFIGGFEKEKHADFFVTEIAAFYKSAGEEKTDGLLAAKGRFENGFALMSQFRYDDSIREFEQSSKAFLKLGNEVEASVAEIWAAQFLPDVLRLEESRTRLNSLVEFAEARKYKVLLPTARYWLGVTDLRQSRVSDSIKNTKLALEIAVETENKLEIDHCAESLAVSYLYAGEFDRSLHYLNRIDAAGDNSRSKTQYWREKGALADLALRLRLLSTASDSAKEAVWVAREVLPKANLINSSLQRLAAISLEKRDFPQALNAAQESLHIAESREESAANNLGLGENYLLTADIRREMGEFDDALADYYRSLGFYAKISEFTTSLYAVHKGKLFCLQALHRQDEFETELAALLELSEKYRREIREDDLRQAFFDSEQDVFDAAISNALERGNSRKAFDLAEISKARSLLDFVKSDKSIAEVEQEFSAVASPLTIDAIQARIPENVQVVQFAVLGDKLAIWSFTKTRFELAEKAISLVELESRIRDYQTALIDKTGGQELEKAASELYSLLIPPNLETGKTLVVIPDKALSGLSFASLRSNGNKYLIEDFPVVYSASSSVFVAATENAATKAPNADERLLGIGNPSFDRTENPKLADLPQAETEARSIAEDYRTNLTFVGGDATKDKFLREVENAEVIHFAGHFSANAQSPGNSKMIFADDDLHAFELAVKKLPKSKLVVLSACETGHERFNRSEGAIGIARTFLAMGAPLVVASGWKVDSEATKDLMISFHRNRKEIGLTSAESLRQAQLEMIRGGGFNAPYYWSAFSLFGGYANY